MVASIICQFHERKLGWKMKGFAHELDIMCVRVHLAKLVFMSYFVVYLLPSSLKTKVC